MKFAIIQQVIIPGILTLFILSSVTPVFAQPGSAPEHSEIRQRLRSTIIPKVELDEATLNETVRFMRQKSRDMDERNRPINFVVHLHERDPNDPRRTVFLEMSNIPISQLLRHVSSCPRSTCLCRSARSNYL